MRKFNVILFLVLILLSLNAKSQGHKYFDTANYYFNNGNLDNAINYMHLQIDEDSLLHNDSLMGLNLNILGFWYKKTGKLDAAEIFYNKAYLKLVQFYGTNSQYVVYNLINLSEVYKLTSRYSEAEKNLLKACEICEKNFSTENIEYSIALNNLGSYYGLLENFEKAEFYNEKAISLRKKKFGENSKEYALSLQNIAVTHIKANSMNLVEPYLLKAIRIYSQNSTSNDDKLSVAIFKRNLANYYYTNGLPVRADSLLKVCLSEIELLIGKKTLEYAFTLTELGNAEVKLKNYDSAEVHFLTALEIRKKNLDETNVELANSYNSLGSMYGSKGDNSNAQKYYYLAKLITEKSIGKESLTYIYYLDNSIALAIETNSFNEAETSVLELNDLIKQMVSSRTTYMSQTEFITYLGKQKSHIIRSYSLLHRYQSKILLKKAYNNLLLINQIVLQNAKQMNNLLYTDNSDIKKRWENFKTCNSLLNKQLALPIAKRNFNTDSLAEIANAQEKELLRQSAAYRDMKAKLSTTWEDVKNHLKNNEAAIEFVKFNALRKEFIEQDTTFYAAMLVRAKDTCPVFINLFEERELQAALKKFAYKANIQNIKDSSYSITQTNKNIYSLLWQPILPYLKNINTVYYAPDGLLHQIAFAAIPYKKDSLLCDKYNLVQVSSTRQVVENQFKKNSFYTAALFGGINYNKQITDSMQTKPDAFAYVYQQNRSANLDSFNYLPNTLKEITSIKQNSEKHQLKVTLFNKENATEAAFRNLSDSQSPSIMHFATHGFTLADAQKQTSTDNNANSFKLSDNPLMRCGLVLAGGNKGWKGRTTIDEDDGILTGLEISNANLTNTELVVLSACETGLGQLAGSEGVFGLQRAFKLAGVNYIMASLWQVPDKETTEFMQMFYGYLFREQNIRTAFIKTQKQMHIKYPPYYWAGFTLVQ